MPDRTMRILYHHRIRSKDGQAVHLEELVGALRELGHEVLLVGPRHFASAEFGYEPTLLAKLKGLIPGAIYELLELGYNLPAFLRLCLAYLRFRPDFVYERYNLYSLAGAILGKLVSAPLLLEVNAPLAHERGRYGGLAFPTLARALETWTWRSAAAVLPVTKVLADEVERGRVSPERIEVIPNAIDLERFVQASSPETAKSQIGLEGKLIVGFIGFARDWHGLDKIVELLARPEVPKNLHAMIVGEGPAIGNLKVLAGALGAADRVTFAGLVKRDKIATFVSALDIALLPSCVDYCSPLKLFEYMALGKAIVAPDQPNIREAVSDGVSALLFGPGHCASMEEGVLRLTADADLRRRLGGAAQSLIRSRGFTWRRNAERVVELGRRLSQKRRDTRVLAAR